MIEYNTDSNFDQINDTNELYYNHINSNNQNSFTFGNNINHNNNNNIINIDNNNSNNNNNIGNNVGVTNTNSTQFLLENGSSILNNLNNIKFENIFNIFSTTISPSLSSSAATASSTSSSFTSSSSIAAAALSASSATINFATEATVTVATAAVSSSSSSSSSSTLSSLSIIDNDNLKYFNSDIINDYGNNGTLNGTIYNDYFTCPNVYQPEDKVTEFEFWICGVILNIVGILGIFGNILSMVILSRPQMRSSINYLLIGLARCDTVLIITSVLLFGIPAIYPYTGYLFYYYYYIYPNISPCIYPIAMASQTASVYLTFTVTLERYVAVCHPLRARALCTYGRAKIYFIICIVFSILYNLPRFWEVIVIAYSPNDHDVIFCVAASKLRRNSNYIRIYIHWCYLVFIYFIPFSTLAILNCLIYRQVQKANRERQRLSRTERREIGLATMLLCVVIVFFLLNFLALYTNILEAFYDIINEYLIKTSNLLVTINSSANFIIYVIFGEKFKRIFLLLFCKGRMTRDTPDLIHYESSISNGDGTNRSSGRFSRHGTTRSTTRNGIVATTTVVGTTNSCRIKRSTTKRNRAPSPGPCVYYPARELQRQTILTHSTSLNCDWDTKNGYMTSGF